MGNVIYIFGGRGVDGQDLGDLAAFKITSEMISLLCCVSGFESTCANFCNRSEMVHVSEHGSFS